MKMKKNILFFLLGSFILYIPVSCQKDETTNRQPATTSPVDGIRIAWDYSTLVKIAPQFGRSLAYCGYSRMVQLHDGRLACVYETSTGNTELTFSTNNGESWSWPKIIFQTANNINMAVPSIIELDDNSIIVACNPRPREPYTEDRKFGIKVRKSTDDGNTWQLEQLIYEAQSTFQDGCWEPALVQLPDGEVQLYFSNEGIYTQSNEQNISILRSFDRGETWTDEPEIVGFRKNHRDGMPVPLVLEDKGEILVSIEDNGLGEFKPAIYREKLEDNWSDGPVLATDPRREYHPLEDLLPRDVYGGGPYISRLSTGEVLLSYQTTLERSDRWNYSTMAVEIGDDAGTLFNRRSFPFDIPISKWGLWNSLSVIKDDIPVAITSTNAFSSGSTEVWMIKGRVIPEFSLPEGTPLIDGSLDDACWNINWPYFIGAYSETFLNASLCSDQQNLYLAVSVNDPELVIQHETNKSDGITLQLDTERKGFLTPQQGIFELYIPVDGELQFREGNSGNWIRREDTSLSSRASVITDNGYELEVSIPWDLLKITSSNIDPMGVNLLLHDYKLTGDLHEETISSNIPDEPYTWCPMIYE